MYLLLSTFVHPSHSRVKEGTFGLLLPFTPRDCRSILSRLLGFLVTRYFQVLRRLNIHFANDQQTTPTTLPVNMSDGPVGVGVIGDVGLSPQWVTRTDYCLPQTITRSANPIYIWKSDVVAVSVARVGDVYIATEMCCHQCCRKDGTNFGDDRHSLPTRSGQQLIHLRFYQSLRVCSCRPIHVAACNSVSSFL